MNKKVITAIIVAVVLLLITASVIAVVLLNQNQSVESPVITDPKSISLKVGNWSYAAYAEVYPSCADCSGVYWHSDNPCVASVNASNGYIYANAVGTARIYATATDGSGCRDYLTVTVNNTVPVSSVTLDRSCLYLEKGQCATISSMVCPDNATQKSLTWSSSILMMSTEMF